ncbi:uncharacterized protein [Physcomitrium patens]|uniref:Maf-like protein n=1 Tax=Physcomitrium patens TaxID=3218 RepID=A0A2K1JRT5_PHYPA|nr:N-acetylserotonin O-methyltransferase-like protein isoform X1 [Physcomitrium patens]XP_024390230.1 N-acetylserotonin O-methyltransferase-like protein isoform X1 [Physcomitrium patens]PNR44245.1 hypothetical protein PHYPA_016629 [Physcomitrium patens]|eukprot:XP_024390229.1 N-acetylserotonin O-methyltransferase-like protein isoform X1 [Physcomitrella patens]
MLIQHVPLLSTKRIVLASASPRRAELLRGLGLKIEIFPSTFEEDLDKSLFANPGEYAKETATRKAHDVYQKIQEAGSGKRADLIIAADTVVELGSQVLEKPRDVDDARRMLSSLSGQVHKVYTGVALVTPKSSGSNSGSSPLLTSFYEGTEVEFAELEEQSILAYIASEEPMDKAGAYGIQGLGGSFVKCIHGCYFNIMGFPIHRFSVEVDRLVKSGAITA